MKTIAIIGFGRFGRALGGLAEEAGMRVRAWDPGLEVPPAHRVEDLSQLLVGAEAVFLAVPLRAVDGVVSSIRPCLDGSQLVLEVCSVKQGPVAAMRETLGREVPWVATHPLFGPTSIAMGDRPLSVVVCPNDWHPQAAAAARTLYEDLGCEVTEQDADDHDRSMAFTHALGFFVAKGLIDVGADEETGPIPPSFKAYKMALEAVRSDSGHLFVTIENGNPHARDARRRLLDAMGRIHQTLVDLPQQQRPAPASLQIPDLGRAAPELQEARDLIDDIDRRLVELLGRRAQLCLRVGRAKEAHGAAIRDPAREQAVLAARKAWAREVGLPPDSVAAVFEDIMAMARSLQR